jgi:hypothetical protein
LASWHPARDRHGPVGPRRQRDGGAAREIARASRRSASTNRALLRDAATIPRPDHRVGRVRFPPPPLSIQFHNLTARASPKIARASEWTRKRKSSFALSSQVVVGSMGPSWEGHAGGVKLSDHVGVMVTSRMATSIPFPVDMDSMASVGAFPSEEEAQAERSGLPVQASGTLQRLTGTPSGPLGWRRRTVAESLGRYRPSLSS